MYVAICYLIKNIFGYCILFIFLIAKIDLDDLSPTFASGASTFGVMLRQIK
jgi:hypothetical protein